jgi:hypothetical protein
MATNFLEQLVAERYEYRGYFVRRNVLKGRREAGGYECELDVVAFHPTERQLIHIEASMDADSWAEREKRFTRKFEAGRKHIPELFTGMNAPDEIKQLAVLAPPALRIKPKSAVVKSSCFPGCWRTFSKI